MPYKDPVMAKQKAKERKKTWQARECNKRIAAGLPADGRGKHGHQVKSGRHYRWNLKLLTSDGYVLIRLGRGHPLADPNGYCHEHLVVWVSAGRPIPKDGELIHHKDLDKTNNRLENLELKTNASHNSFHNNLRGRNLKGQFLAGHLLDGKEWMEFPK